MGMWEDKLCRTKVLSICENKRLLAGCWAEHLVGVQGLKRDVMSASPCTLEEGLLTMQPYNYSQYLGHIILWEAIHKAINKTCEPLRNYKSRSLEVHLNSRTRRKQLWAPLGLTVKWQWKMDQCFWCPKPCPPSQPLISVTFWWTVSCILIASHSKTT